MFAVPGVIDLPPKGTNISRRRFLTRVFSGFKSLNSSLLNAPKTPRPLIDLEKRIKKIGAIEEVIMIMALANPDL